jgi:hypothetical protein
MSIVLLLLGILAAGSGLAAIGFGISLNGTDLGHTLIMAGTTGLTGGLILIGLAGAVRQLARIADGLRRRPQARPARPVEAQLRPEAAQQRFEPMLPRAEPVAPLAEVPHASRAPEPRPAGMHTDVSSSAIERLRSSLPRPDRVVPEAEGVPLSPNGHFGQQPAEPAAEPNPAAARSGPGEVETARQPRLDFLFRSRTTRTEQSESSETLWPKRSTRQREAQPQGDDVPTAAEQTPPAAETVPAGADRIAPEPVAAPMMNEPPSVAILKSGVVDGMAYTLYADGSIEAQLPQGTLRFGSITELRAHIEKNS